MVAAGSDRDEHRRVRVAVDLADGERLDPATLLDVVLAAARECPDVAVVLVATPEMAVLASEHPSGRDAIEVLPATAVVRDDAEPVRAVRSTRGATVRVAARAVRDGRVDAMVSFGSPIATVAAASFTLDAIPGATRAVLAARVTTPRGPLVLVDVSGSGGATGDELAQAAVLGSALARRGLGVGAPRVGLLASSAAPSLAASLAELCTGFVGAVTGADVVQGGAADVVVVDGFTGAALLSAVSAASPGSAVDARVLGVAGVVTVGLVPATATSVAHCVAAAAAASRPVTPALGEAALSDLVRFRRSGLEQRRGTPAGQAR